MSEIAEIQVRTYLAVQRNETFWIVFKHFGIAMTHAKLFEKTCMI